MRARVARGGMTPLEHRIVRLVDQRLGTFRGEHLCVVLRGVDVAPPDLARQLVEHFDPVTIGIRDVDAVGHAVVDPPVELHALRLEKRHLLEPRLAIRPGDRHVIDAGAARHQIPFRPHPVGAVALRHLAERQIVMADVAMRVDAAVEAHRRARPVGRRLQLGDAAQPDDLGPELVRHLDVRDVQHEVIDAERCDRALRNLRVIRHGVLPRPHGTLIPRRASSRSRFNSRVGYDFPSGTVQNTSNSRPSGSFA